MLTSCSALYQCHSKQDGSIMCNFLHHRLIHAVAGAALAACGSGLTLPDGGSPDDGSPAAISAYSGSGQQGTIGSRLDEPLIVRVTDASSQPLAGVAVEFRFQSETPKGEVDPTSAVTDSAGRTAAQVRLGTEIGAQIVEARVAQVSTSELRATFDLTAVAPEHGNRGRGRNHDDDDDEEDEDND
jgi:hypothetical protein